MIPQEKNEAVTRGLREAFSVSEFRRYLQADPGAESWNTGLSHRRAGTRVPVAHHYADRRSYAPFHQHDGGGSGGPGAARLVHQHSRSHFHH